MSFAAWEHCTLRGNVRKVKIRPCQKEMKYYSYLSQKKKNFAPLFAPRIEKYISLRKQKSLGKMN